MKVSRPILPILTLKLVAMATSLERSEKKVWSIIYDCKYPPYGENLVKIGPVDPKITGREDAAKIGKNKEKNISRTYSPQGRHAARGKLRY